MPIPPIGTPVNLVGQWIMTVCVIVALVAAAISAARMSRRLHTPAPLILLAGSLLAGFIEPMYCLTMHLWYYRIGQWTMYSAMNVSQPIWSWLSYGAFYGGLALLVWWRVEQGASRSSITRLGGVLLVVSIATELVCINLGTYEYYGSHPFRVGAFPVWIAVANAVVGVVAGIVAARLRPLLPGAQAWAYLALIPVAMTAIQFGTGFLALDVINTPDPSIGLLYSSAVASMALAGTVAFVALKLVPSGSPTNLSVNAVVEDVAADRAG
ncbi:MAG: hypothetical protein WCE30_09575 [Mycobacterium sp.]